MWIGARDPERGRAAAEELGARFVALDVTDDASVAAAAETVGELDVLINNAGISGGRDPGRRGGAGGRGARVRDERVRARARDARVPAAAASARTNPVIVNVSSGMGSFAVTTDPERVESTIVGLSYPASKSAVTMLTTQYAKAFPGMRVNAVDPGYTATDLNGHSGPQTVTEGTDAIVAMAHDRTRRPDRHVRRPPGRRTLVMNGLHHRRGATAAAR